MVELWFGLLCFTLTLFVGARRLEHRRGRSAPDRRQDRRRAPRDRRRASGRSGAGTRSGSLAFGGTFLLAFPGVMATSFAGFYLALWLVLWSFILRGISIEVGGHIHDRLWQSWWDFVFAVSSVLLAVLFGAALGNVIRGVPLDESGKFSMSLFTDFGVRGRVGILDWYTVSVAVFTTVLLSAHGATYLRLKTTVRCISEANVSRAGCGQPRSCSLPSSRWKPGSSGRRSTGRWSSGLSPGWRSRLSWLESGRSLPGCAEPRRAAPLRDRAR